MHEPALQTLVPLQTVPQAPQLVLSVLASTQVPPHSVLLVSVHLHTLLAQLVAVGQAASHAPQCASLVAVFTHAAAESHHRVPNGQTHAPPLHASPLPHHLPQVPQFDASLESETQLLPHGEVEPAHTQLPALQYLPEAHATPHAPQFAESLLRLTQLVPHGVRPDAEQVHAPPLHACALPHTVPQVPQFDLSFTGTQRSAQTRPLSQVHTPPVQRSPLRQTLPHAPQFSVSLEVCRQLLPQTTPPKGHWHVPPMQLVPDPQ
jgi:hypothetical protein